MRWVFGESRVPDHGDGVLGNLEGCGAGYQRRGRSTLAEARGCGENEIALGDDFERGREVRDAEGDASLQAACVEKTVDDAKASAARRDQDVIESGEGFEGESTGR